MHVDLRLRLLKTLVNFPLRVLDRFLTDPAPRNPQTVIFGRVFERMFKAYSLEVAQGVFQEADGRAADGNFLRLLRVMQKLTTSIADEDRYYREWLGLLIVLCHEEYVRYLDEVSPSEIKRLCHEQWSVSPSALSDRFIASLKPEFVPDVLTYYLHTLSKPEFQPVGVMTPIFTRTKITRRKKQN